MKREIKNFGKYVEIILIFLTLISLLTVALEYTNMIYNWSYDTTMLNNLVTSKLFNVILWIDNVLIYLLSIFYIIDTIQTKKNIFLKLSFCLFSIFTTMVVSSCVINFIASLFGVF